MANYVDNEKMLEEIKKYRENVRVNKELGLEKPRIPNYLGECIIKIANNLSHNRNFIGYSFKEEMILDGIENCVRYIGSFDPERGSNPFAYFTQVINYAFIRRITKEKKQSYVKGKLIQNYDFSAFDMQEHDDDEDFMRGFESFLQNNSNFDDSFIKNKEKKKKAKENVQSNPLENIMS